MAAGCGAGQDHGTRGGPRGQGGERKRGVCVCGRRLRADAAAAGAARRGVQPPCRRRRRARLQAGTSVSRAMAPLPRVPQVVGVEVQPPFQRLTYAEAMAKYASGECRCQQGLAWCGGASGSCCWGAQTASAACMARQPPILNPGRSSSFTLPTHRQARPAVRAGDGGGDRGGARLRLQVRGGLHWLVAARTDGCGTPRRLAWNVVAALGVPDCCHRPAACTPQGVCGCGGRRRHRQGHPRARRRGGVQLAGQAQGRRVE